MVSRKGLFVLSVAALASLVGGAAFAAGEKTVTPGMGIGPLRVGMARTEALKAMGPAKPVSTTKLRGGYTEDVWRTDPAERKDPPERTLAALSKDGRVVQLAVTDRAYRTAAGVSVATPFARLRTLFALRAVHDFEMIEEGGGGYVLIVADDVARGVAFTTGTQDDRGTFESLPKLTPGSVVVHAPGKPALPAEFGLIGKPSKPFPDSYVPRIRAYLRGGPHP
jgi:hypothetical protein